MHFRANISLKTLLPIALVALALGAIGSAQEIGPLSAPDALIDAPSLAPNASSPAVPGNAQAAIIKGVGAAAICVEVLISGFVPQLLLRVGPRWLGLANSLGGGIFLGATFFFLLPEVSFNLHGVVPKGGYPLGALLILVGYIAILCFERVLFQHRHHHHDAADRDDSDTDHHDHDHHHHDHDHEHGGDSPNAKKRKHSHKHKHHPSRDFTAVPAVWIEEDSADSIKHAQLPQTSTSASAPTPTTPLLLPSPQPSLDGAQYESEQEEESRFQRKALFASLLVFLMLTVHSCFEGIVLGVSPEDESTIAILIAIISHKWVESLSLGIIMIKEGLRRLYFVIIMIAFSLLTPLGIMIGALAEQQMSESVVSAFNAVATGTFFYIGTTEIIAEEFHTHHHKAGERWLKFFALFLGCAIMATVRIWTGDEDHAHHGH